MAQEGPKFSTAMPSSPTTACRCGPRSMALLMWASRLRPEMKCSAPSQPGTGPVALAAMMTIQRIEQVDDGRRAPGTQPFKRALRVIDAELHGGIGVFGTAHPLRHR